MCSVTNNTLIVLPACPSRSIRPVETLGEIWQLPRQDPGAPPTVFPWCVRLHNPDGGWSELSLVLIIAGSSSKQSQIILLACLHTPGVQNLPSRFVKYWPQPSDALFSLRKPFSACRRSPFQPARGQHFCSPLPIATLHFFSLKFKLLDRKTKVKRNSENFLCVYLPCFPVARNWAETVCAFSLELFWQTAFHFCVRYFCCSSYKLPTPPLLF